MKVLILINEDTDFMHGYQQGNRLMKAYETTFEQLMVQEAEQNGDFLRAEEIAVPDDVHALEDVFRIFNICHPKDYRNRSLSIGDVVVLGETPIQHERAFSCQTVGFKVLPAVPKF